MKSCFVNINSSVSPYTMPLHHSHNFYELYVLAEGKRTIYLENEEYLMEQNDLLLIPTGLMHRTNGGHYTRYLVNFTPEYLDEEQLKIVKLCQQHKITLTREELNRLLDVIEKMDSIQTETANNEGNKNYPNRELNEYNLRVCFSYFLFTLSTCKNFPTQRYTQQRKYNMRTKKIMDYIQKNYAEKITLDSLCKMFYVSKAALCNDFKKNTGMSIIDYLLKSRINHARFYLVNTDKKINAIAEICGFSSQKYFYLIFTKHIGVSPSEYRKSHQITCKNQPK